MTAANSRKYDLVPATDPSEPPVAPVGFFPAIPITLGEAQTPVVYATIDVTLQVSVVSPALLEKMGVPSPRPREHGSPKGLVLIYLSTTVLDRDLEPWFRLDKVPFSVPSTTPQDIGRSRATLGFRGFLSNLKLAIDFPKKVLSISSPQRFLLPSRSSREPLMPSSILQAEDLISSGSYSSGVALTVSGLEELLSPEETFSSSSVALASLTDIVRFITADDTLARALADVYALRNRAVHGSEDQALTRAEARKALSVAKRIIRATHRSA
jgi:hypothetical protein